MYGVKYVDSCSAWWNAINWQKKVAKKHKKTKN